MVFSSIIFLCVFLPIVLIVYYICPPKFRNLFLLMASLVFYGWGEPKYIVIMLFSTVFDYCNGLALEHFDNKNKEGARKAVIILSVVVNIGILFFFKYTDFFIENVNYLTGNTYRLLEIALPIGISFYTFQTLSYTIDVYRRKVKAQKNFIAFAMYVAMFPQLIAGPIVRYESVKNQVNIRTHSFKKCSDGMTRFIIGLGKKVILANQIGALWDEILGCTGTSDMSVGMAWLGAICYTFQIYFDFSGYSDMAIGLGKMFGFEFPENFNYPYEANSITDFWRRWHMTLGTWFREYVYIPLGGNRKGFGRQIINLFIVWFLTGFWHGASWNFIFWGLYFFVILLLEKLFILNFLKKLPAFVSHIYSIILIVFGWVIFACDDLNKMTDYIKAMFGVGDRMISTMTIYDLYTYAVFIVILVIASTSIPKRLVRDIFTQVIKDSKRINRGRILLIRQICIAVFTFAILFVSITYLVSGSYNPFLYFRF